MHSEATPPGQLSAQDFERIRNLARRKEYRKDETIFSDGDSADYIYFIEDGHTYIFIDKFTSREEVSTMGAGEYFGEMAFFSGDRRSASAAALLDSTLLLLERNTFLSLFESDQELAAKINGNFARRNRELAGKEALGGWDSGGQATDVLGDGLRTSLAEWQPVSRQQIARTLSRLAHLRMIPDFYLRNFTISIIRDAIRMQFNCDGTQIVSARGFQQFIEDNLLEEELGGEHATERRAYQRRHQDHASVYMLGERRSPPGRRQEDWIAFADNEPRD